MTAAPLFAPVLPPGTSPARPAPGESPSDVAGLFALLLAGAQPVQADMASGAGTIAPSSLEDANVDLAEEFTKMMVTKGAHAANARVITTTDEMLDQLIRISR